MAQMGRPKTGNSLDDLGRVLIASDKHTRDALKAKARAEGLTMAEYLRKIASEGSGAMLSTTLPASKSDVKQLYKFMALMMTLWVGLPAVCFNAEEYQKVMLNFAEQFEGLETMTGNQVESLFSRVKNAINRAKESQEAIQGEFETI